MNDNYINQLESKLEQLVEGTFTSLFRKRISTHDIAVKLVRSMEAHLHYVNDHTRPQAPDLYTLEVNPALYKQIEKFANRLETSMSEQLIEIATQSNYHLRAKPIVRFIGNPAIDEGDVTVTVAHSLVEEHSTQAMTPIKLPKPVNQPLNPHLIINGKRIIPLIEPLLNIGRSDENHVVIEDNFVSRHHLQIRRRFGLYTLFDVNSRGGTMVNNTIITEHQLQAGDVIQIGNTQIIYLTDDEKDGGSPLTTQTIEPVDF